MLYARRSNQSILKEINPEHSLKGLMLKLQYFGHLMQRTDSLEKILMLGKIEGKRKRGWQKMRWLDGITDSMDMNLSKLQEIVKGQGAWHTTVQFSSAQSLSRVWLFVTSWIAARQASLSIKLKGQQNMIAVLFANIPLCPESLESVTEVEELF